MSWSESSAHSASGLQIESRHHVPLQFTVVMDCMVMGPVIHENRKWIRLNIKMGSERKNTDLVFANDVMLTSDSRLIHDATLQLIL